MKRAARLAVLILCVVFSVAAVVNVFGDNAEVELMGKMVACAEPAAKPAATAATAPPPKAGPVEACSMTMTRTSRTPLAQSFEFSGRSTVRKVRCSRSLILVGEYACVPE